MALTRMRATVSSTPSSSDLSRGAVSSVRRAEVYSSRTDCLREATYESKRKIERKNESERMNEGTNESEE
jgi:hypothetical protein